MGDDSGGQSRYIKIAIGDQRPLILKVWFRTQEVKAEVLENIRERFKAETGSDVLVEELDELEGLRQCGLYVLALAPSWEELVAKGAITPLVSNN